jgi:hypothetical protein
MIVRRRAMRPFMAPGIFLLAASLSACSSAGNADSTASAHRTHGTPSPRALNVTPCNYVQVWLDDPSKFSEFSTTARFARVATDADLRSQGRQLAAAAAANDSSTVTAVMGKLVSTCEHLGLVHSSPTTTTTTTSP